VPASSEVDYGQGSSYALSAVDGALVTSHSLNLLADPGEPYHFVVKSVDANGTTATSSTQSFHTKGVNLTVTVVDPQGKPLKGAVVTYENNLKTTLLEKITATTDSQGQATLANLPVGPKTPVNLVVTTSYHGKVLSDKIQIQPIANAGVNQNTKVVLKPGYPVVVAVIGLGIAVVIIGLLYAIRTAKKRSAAAAELNRHFPTLPGGASPSGGGAGPFNNQQPPTLP
jgi:hypothetical protein